jgi:hypothetical protein
MPPGLSAKLSGSFPDDKENALNIGGNSNMMQKIYT